MGSPQFSPLSYYWDYVGFYLCYLSLNNVWGDSIYIFFFFFALWIPIFYILKIRYLNVKNKSKLILEIREDVKREEWQ